MTTWKEWLAGRWHTLLFMALGLYLLVSFQLAVGFPPNAELQPSVFGYLVAGLFLLVMPFAHKISLGNWLRYEAKVEEVRTDVRDFRGEVRELISMQNAAIASVSNSISHNVSVTLPGFSQLREARAELDRTIKSTQAISTIEDDIERFIMEGGNDVNFALAKMRMELESELRRLLGKRVETPDPQQMRGRFLSARSLFNKFVAEQPDYAGMTSSFDYILKMCNAAIHGQRISEGQAHEALYMGMRMLEELRRLP